MLMIIAMLAQYEVPRSTINYHNYRSHDMFRLISFWMTVAETCQMTFNLNFKKKKVPQFLIINKWVGAHAARKGSEVNFWLKQTN